jgi:hypothetical protein
VRYDHRGTSLWYGTADAPAPEHDVLAPSGIASGLSVTVGVRPIGSRYSVEVRYRVNAGASVRVPASLARTDVHSNTQHFVAPLPNFHVGDTIDYVAVLSAPGLQMPVGPDAARFQLSFRVVAQQASSAPTKAGPTGAPAGVAAPPPAPSTPITHVPSTAEKPPVPPSALTVAAATAIAADLHAHSGSIAEFWQTLQKKPGFQDPHRIANLQFALQLGHLADGQPALVDAIHASGQYKSIRDLALATDRLASHVGGVPEGQLSDMPGATVEAKRHALVQHLQDSLHAAFPTEAVAVHLEKEVSAPAHAARFKVAADFLKRASTPGALPNGVQFDLASTHVESFCKAHGDALFPGVSEPERRKTIEDIKRTQRVFRVSTDPTSVGALLTAGFDSAHSISRLPKKAFIAKFGTKLGGPEAAALLHDQATSVAAVSAALAAHIRTATSTHRSASTGAAIKQMPGWADMFGGLDICECPESDSIYGAPAYLVDLLQFLESSTANDKGLTPLDHLLGKHDAHGKHLVVGRRPDLGHVLLTAENTETTIPYVDLVNEILESYVVHNQPVASAAHDVAGRTAKELLANPQYVQAAAYDKLSTAVYPPTLPFDRSLETIRLNLAQLTSARLDVMRAFALDDASRWTPPFVAEALGLSAQEYAIITGSHFDGSSAAISVRALYGSVDGKSLLALGEELQPVRGLLARTGVSYVELLDILKCPFVNPGARELRLVELVGLTHEEIQCLTSTKLAAIPSSVQQKLSVAGHSSADLQKWLTALTANATTVAPDEGCDLDEANVQRRDGSPLDDDTLLNLHRFVRLWHRLGTSIADTEAILTAVAFKKDPVRGVQQLAQAREIASQLDIDLGQTVPFWASINTFGPASTYRRLFENRAFHRDPDPAFRLAATEDELDHAIRGTPDPLTSKAASVAAALRVREQDIFSIAAAAGLAPTVPVNIQTISTLHRHVTLARSLGLPLRLVLEVKRLVAAGRDPFANPFNLLQFIKTVRLIANASLTAERLAFLCRHEDSAGTQISKTLAAATALTSRLATLSAAAAVEDDNLLKGPSADGLRTKLAQVIDAASLPDALAIIDGTSKLSSSQQSTFISTPGRFDVFMDVAQAVSMLGASIDADPEKREEQQVQRRATVLKSLLPYLERQAIRAAIAESIGIQDGDLLARLLDTAAVMQSTVDTESGLLTDLLSTEDGQNTARLEAYSRLSKAAALLTQFNLSAPELDLLLAEADRFGGFSLNNLAAKPNDGRAMFSGLCGLIEYAAFRDDRGGGAGPLLLALRASSEPDRLAALSGIAGVSTELAKEAVTQLGLSPGSLGQVSGVSSLLALLALAGTTGASPTQLKRLAASPSADGAELTRLLVKARFDEASWMTIARTVSDALREQQRASLVAYLLTTDSLRNAGVSTSDQLFEYFLIDVQMDPCMLTSRIKQAISSVQLFVDRCLLNLEVGVRPSAIDASQWEWRKNYRVCQANHKVFWHTESYLEPEWRDDRTPLFREVESEIMQGDASDAAVERAFRSYATKLDEIANLETCGLFFEPRPGNGSRSVLHVVARTRTGAPRRYFYRQWVDGIVWTAWEALELDISGQEDGDTTGVHVLPFVWRDRNYILWLTFLQKMEKPRYKMVDANKGFTPEDPPKYWEIKLAWSIRENDKWSPKRLTSAKYEYPPLDVRMRALDKLDQLSAAEEKTHDELKQLQDQVKNERDGLKKMLDAIDGLPAILGLNKEAMKKAMRAPIDQAIAADEAHIARLNASLADDKRQALTDKDFGTVGDFHLRAMDLGSTLAVYVTNRRTTTAGRFELSSRNEDFTFSPSAWPWETTLAHGARRDFQAEYVRDGLTLSSADPAARNEAGTTLLGSAPGGYRVVPTAQSLGVPISYPAFVETRGATYVMALKPNVSSLHQILRNPNLAHPPESTTAVSVHTGSVVQHLASSHPWERTSATLGALAQHSADQHQNAIAALLAHPPPRRLTTPGPAAPAHRPAAHQAVPAHAPAAVHASSHPAVASHVAAKPLVFTPKAPNVTASFQTAFHPYANEFIKRLNEGGVPRLLSMDTQALGNPYFRAPWNRAARLSDAAAGAASIIEGGVGLDSEHHRPGNLEAVVWEGSHLVHLWHDSGHVETPWYRGATIETQATGPGCICERLSQRAFTGHAAAAKVQRRGALEVVVPRKDGLAHYSLSPDPHASWTFNGLVTPDAAGSGCITETHAGGAASLDVLVPEKVAGAENLRLVHYRMDHQTSAAGGAGTAAHSGRWTRVDTVTENTAGPGCLIESSYQTDGKHRLDALALEGDVGEPASWQVVHYKRDAAAPEWVRGSVLSNAASGPAWLMQSRVQDSTVHGNFEAVVQETTQLVHYWCDNSVPSAPWHRGRVISAMVAGPGSIIQSTFGNIGNFEVLVPEISHPSHGTELRHALEHYWLANDGPPGALTERFYFRNVHQPDPRSVLDPFPRNEVDFTFGSPYSQYNWEIFYHLPMLIATRLLHNQRYTDARKWLSYVFNIQDDSNEITSHRFWRCLPLRDEEGERFEQVVAAMRNPGDEGRSDREAIHRQISYWLAHPFMPHRIAQMRTEAYKKFTVTRGTDILLAEGDSLFRQDTIEAINLATQRYVTARNIHGDRPERVPRPHGRTPKTYAQLSAAGIDDTGNAAVQLENEFPTTIGSYAPTVSGPLSGMVASSSNPYFCVPANTKLLQYWDTIDDRLYKIRHCMNIEGVVRQLPLFEPPIDPAMLIAAASQGIPLGAALAALGAPLPYYRFSFMLQKALEACNEVKSLGGMLLSALEKVDAEHIANVRAHQETLSGTRMTVTKTQAKAEAQKNYEGLKFNRTTAIRRWQHYQELLGQSTPEPPEPEVNSSVVDGVYKVVSRIVPLADYTPSGRFQLVDMGDNVGVVESDNPGTKILSFEREELENLFSATAATLASQAGALIAQVLHFIPHLEGAFKPFGAGGGLSFGGQELGAAAEITERVANILTTVYSHNASRAAKLGSFVLREREWAQQNNQAARDIASIDYQLVSAQIRLDIADREVDHQKQVAADAKELESLLKSKFTNEELYVWMRDQLLSHYRASYQLAVDQARQAEQCFRFERGVPDANFIQLTGYFSDAKSGLLAGEQLQMALHQMEKAYEEQNARDYELTLNASILSIDPLQLVSLKETGACEFELPEALLDFKWPGHYCRRIKTVSVTIPCVVGPYSSVSCTLRLLENTIRYKSIVGTSYPRSGDDDDRFITNHAATTAVALSGAQNDAGVFELNLHDERYLPFEGAGAISRWRIELNAALPDFDYETISDVILHIRYTAREGGARLKAAAIKSLTAAAKTSGGFPLLDSTARLPLVRLLSLRHEFPAQWNTLLRPTKSDDSDPLRRVITIPLSKARFPYFVAGATLQPQSVAALAIQRGGTEMTVLPMSVKADPDSAGATELTLQLVRPRFGGALFGKTDDAAEFPKIETDESKPWRLDLSLSKAQWRQVSTQLQDMFLVVEYTASFGR